MPVAGLEPAPPGWQRFDKDVSAKRYPVCYRYTKPTIGPLLGGHSSYVLYEPIVCCSLWNIEFKPVRVVG